MNEGESDLRWKVAELILEHREQFLLTAWEMPLGLADEIIAIVKAESTGT